MDISRFFKLEDVYIFLITAVIFFFLHLVAGGAIKKSRMANDIKRRTLAKLKYFLIFALIILIFVLWATELYQFVISFAAIMAAMAIATKEVVLCLGGSFYRAFASPFTVGDRIEVHEVRGDVVDIGLLGTQLLEVGPGNLTHQYTGRAITIPNSVFLSHNIINESDSITSDTEFALHVFIVPIKNDTHWKEHKDKLYEAANKVCAEYTEPATKYFKKLTKKRQVDMPAISPKINIKFDTPEILNLVVRVTVPVVKKGTIEQEIVRSYLEQSYHE